MYFPILSAILGILAFNTKFSFLALIALAPLFLFFVYEKRLWKLLAGAFLFRLIFAFGTVYFVIDPILYFLSILIFLGLPLSFYIIRKYISPPAAFYLLPILWTFWDYLEAQYTLLPMTLVMFGNPLAESPFLGLARFGGIIGLTFFAALINMLFAYGILMRRNNKFLKLAAVSVAVVLVTGWWISFFSLKGNKNDYSLKNKILNVVLISAEKVRKNFDSALSDLSLDKSVDLVVAPENFYKSNLENSEETIDFYKKTAEELGVNLMVVTLRKDNEKTFKSGILLSFKGDILDVYDKNYLTITSENWPFKNWQPLYFNSYYKKASLEEKQRAVFDSRYQHTKGLLKLLSNHAFSFANPICLEFHYPGYVKKMAGLNPDFILHNSNNDWINRGLSQYLRFTNNLRRIYAVWLEKPILVNGIADYAGVFYPDGSERLAYPEEGAIFVNVEVRL